MMNVQHLFPQNIPNLQLVYKYIVLLTVLRVNKLCSDVFGIQPGCTAVLSSRVLARCITNTKVADEDKTYPGGPNPDHLCRHNVRC